MRKYRDAAEALFIRQGYEGTSIRAISARTRMNLATVVYHWGTKEALFRDILHRRFDAICAEQVRRLRAIEDDGNPPQLDEILRALVEPPLLLPSSERAARRMCLLYGRALTDPSPVIAGIMREMLLEASDLILRLLTTCLPELDKPTLFRRYTCAIGAFIFTQGFRHRMAEIVTIEGSSSSLDLIAQEIVAFMQAGLQHDMESRRRSPGSG